MKKGGKDGRNAQEVSAERKKSTEHADLGLIAHFKSSAMHIEAALHLLTLISNHSEIYIDIKIKANISHFSVPSNNFQ